MGKILAAVLGLALSLQSAPAAAFGGPSNIVIANNNTDGRLAIRSNVQVMSEPGMIAAPQNFAFARASCVGCQTLAVALQLNFAGTDARFVAPQNVAVAANDACTDCTTIAIAFQVFLPLDDPTTAPAGVQDAMREFNAELRAVSTDPDITLWEAEARIVSIVQLFADYATALDAQRSVSE